MIDWPVAQAAQGGPSSLTSSPGWPDHYHKPNSPVQEYFPATPRRGEAAARFPEDLRAEPRGRTHAREALDDEPGGAAAELRLGPLVAEVGVVRVGEDGEKAHGVPPVEVQASAKHRRPTVAQSPPPRTPNVPGAPPAAFSLSACRCCDR